ncbi:MAG: carboxymuconolactone decarboxylase family protein [Kofleriaceae bacterium]
MARDQERAARAAEPQIVQGLPAVPGILTALRLTPGLGTHLSGLADQLLVVDHPGATISRGERELIATAVSGGNNCFYCMDTHGAFASELLKRANVNNFGVLVDDMKSGNCERLTPKLAALVDIALIVRENARLLTRAHVEKALAYGASDADTQLAVMIAAAFCMYNRIVDGFRAQTPPSTEAYGARAVQIADHGYSDPKTSAIPR